MVLASKMVFGQKNVKDVTALESAKPVGDWDIFE